MKAARGSFGPVCLLTWIAVLIGLWLWHRADRSLPTYVREPFEGAAAEARIPSQGGRYAFLLAWPQRVAELEDPVHLELSAGAMDRGTVSVGAAGTAPVVSAWAALDGRTERPALDALVPGHAYRPWTFLGAKELPPGDVLVRLALPDGIALADADATTRATTPATESKPIRPSHLWVVPLSKPDLASSASDPQAMIVCAAVATLLSLIAYGVGRRGAPAAGKILFAMWLVVVVAAAASWWLFESRRAPIRVPLQDGVGSAEFDCRNVRMRFFLSFDDRPAGPEGARHVALPAAAWARGRLTLSETLIVGPDYDWHPCLASGRWDLLSFLGHFQGPMKESPESGYEPFVAASSRTYLGERRFLDGRNVVRFSMPTAPLPEGMPTRSPTSLWLVPDRPDPLMENLGMLFLMAVVGASGVLLLLAGWVVRTVRRRSAGAGPTAV